MLPFTHALIAPRSKRGNHRRTPHVIETLTERRDKTGGNRGGVAEVSPMHLLRSLLLNKLLLPSSLLSVLSRLLLSPAAAFSCTLLLLSTGAGLDRLSMHVLVARILGGVVVLQDLLVGGGGSWRADGGALLAGGGGRRAGEGRRYAEAPLGWERGRMRGGTADG